MHTCIHTYEYLQRDFEKAQKDAELTKLYIHAYIHTYAYLQRDFEKAQKDAELSKLDLHVVMEGEALLKQRIRALEDEVDTRGGKDRQVCGFINAFIRVCVCVCVCLHTCIAFASIHTTHMPMHTFIYTYVCL